MSNFRDSDERLVEDSHRPEIIRLHETEEKVFRYKKRTQRKNGQERAPTGKFVAPLFYRHRRQSDRKEKNEVSGPKEPYQFSLSEAMPDTDAYSTWTPPPRSSDEGDYEQHKPAARTEAQVEPYSYRHPRKQAEPRRYDSHHHTPPSYERRQREEPFPEDRLYHDAYREVPKRQSHRESNSIRRFLSKRQSNDHDSFPSMMESEVSSSHTDSSWPSDDLWIRSNKAATEPEPDTRYNNNAYTYTSYKPTKETASNTIEVAPGQFVRLRGAEESWKAIQVDFIMPCECVCCQTTLFCIEDAEYCLCPTCKTVLPMDGAKGGGVGLGFGLEDLAKWQTEIESSRF